MNCEEASRGLVHMAEGTISAEESWRLRAHLRRCVECRLEADAQTFVRQVLTTRPEEPLPAGFAASLAERLDREATPWLTLLNWQTWSIRLMPAAVVLLVWAVLTTHASLSPQPTDLSHEMIAWEPQGGVAALLARPDVSDSSLLVVLLSHPSTSPEPKEQR
jgi:hypothetical protein